MEQNRCHRNQTDCNVFFFVSFSDCPKVLTLYGMSNLVSESEHSLDLMDPYQRDAKTIGTSKLLLFVVAN
jgi:hypothetical protein